MGEAEETKAEVFVVEKIAPVILSTPFKIITMIGLVSLFAFSILIIATRIDVGFRPEDLAHSSSKALGFWRNFQENFLDFTDLLQLQVIFNMTTQQFGRNCSKIREKTNFLVEKIKMDQSFYWDDRLDNVPMLQSQIDPSEELENAIEIINNGTKNEHFHIHLEIDGKGSERIAFFNTFQLRNLSELERGAQLVKYLAEFQKVNENGDKLKIFISDRLQVFRIYAQINELPWQFLYFGLIAVGSTVITAAIMIP